jgi:hypothetical protein
MASKATKLSKKEKGFLKDYVKTGNGTEAALKNYDTTDENVAASIASENLRKPKIVKTLAEYFPDDFLAQHHLELINQKKVEYFVFSKKLKDEEIEQLVEESGFKVINIRATMMGKMAFYSVPDSKAKKDALDMAYKIKSTYAPEKYDVKGELKVEKLEEIQGATQTILKK